ncbi:MAG: NADH-quinone oxidoreductase subunit C [Dethiobacteria bacterium]|jgi:membrane-bound hydrogenase subunit beta
MQTEEAIVQRLCSKFSFLKDRIYVQKKNRIMTAFLPREEFEEVLHYVYKDEGFYRASHVVGTDEGDALGFIYLLTNDEGIIFALKEIALKSDPTINSLAALYPSLDFHERELEGLFGANVQGLPAGPPYPLPDGWPEGNYPLRKEWNPDYFDRNTLTYNPPADLQEKEGEKK